MEPKLDHEGLYYQDYCLKDHRNFEQAKHFVTQIVLTLRKIRNNRFEAQEPLVSLLDSSTQVSPAKETL